MDMLQHKKDDHMFISKEEMAALERLKFMYAKKTPGQQQTQHALSAPTDVNQMYWKYHSSFRRPNKAYHVTAQSSVAYLDETEYSDNTCLVLKF